MVPIAPSKNRIRWVNWSFNKVLLLVIKSSGSSREGNTIVVEYNHCLRSNQAILLRSLFKFWENMMAQPGILQVLKSVLSAFVGIQSKENRELDFTQGKVSQYIVVGAIMTVLFIATLVFLVSMII